MSQTRSFSQETLVHVLQPVAGRLPVARQHWGAGARQRKSRAREPGPAPAAATRLEPDQQQALERGRASSPRSRPASAPRPSTRGSGSHLNYVHAHHRLPAHPDTGQGRPLFMLPSAPGGAAAIFGKGRPTTTTPREQGNGRHFALLASTSRQTVVMGSPTHPLSPTTATFRVGQWRPFCWLQLTGGRRRQPF